MPLNEPTTDYAVDEKSGVSAIIITIPIEQVVSVIDELNAAADGPRLNQIRRVLFEEYESRMDEEARDAMRRDPAITDSSDFLAGYLAAKGLARG